MNSSQTIGRRGEDLFRTLLPAEWLKHKRDPDIHVDFLVEPVFEGRLADRQVFFQVKTQERVSNAKLPSVRIEIETLQFAKSNRVPVFVALVDLSSKCAWFASLSEISNRHSIGSKIWQQKKVSLQLSRDDQIADEKRLWSAVCEAWEDASERYPGSMKAAARESGKKIINDDPRFRVKTVFDGESESHRLEPVPGMPVEMQFTFTTKSKDALSAVRKLFDFGGRLTPSQDLEIQVKDAPGQFGQTQSVGIELFMNAAGEVQWKFRDKNGGTIGTHSFGVTWKGGAKRLVADFAEPSPSVVRGQHWVGEDPSGGIEGGFQVNLDLTGWDGVDCRSLPGFKKFESIFGGCERADRMEIVAEVDGKEIKGVVSGGKMDYVRVAGAVVHVINHVRAIADIFSKSINWDISRFDEEFLTIDSIVFCFSPGGCSIGSGQLTMTCESELQAKDVIGKSSSGGRVRHEAIRELIVMGQKVGNVLEQHTVRVLSTSELITKVDSGYKITIDFDEGCRRLFPCSLLVTK